MQRIIDTPQSVEQPTHVPEWVLNALLGIVVALVVALSISLDLGGTNPPDALAYLFAGGFGVFMLARRRFPMAVLIATMCWFFAYYALGYPTIGLAMPVVAALYSAAERGRLTAAIIVSLTLVSVALYFRVQDGKTIVYLLGYELVTPATLMAAAIALGDSTRVRRALRAEQEHTARLIAQEHAYHVEQRVQAERVRMARDLHDLLGHSISVISLHSDVAREAIGINDDQARQALVRVRAASAHTMRELRSIVKLLRGSTREPADRAIISLTDLSSLIENVRASGLTLDVRITGTLDTLPAHVDTAAYRIIQESFTNILRHALATQVVLTVAIEPQGLKLHIVDNGRAAVGHCSIGNGIVGMKERARLVGGMLTAQPCATGGFEVIAALPMRIAND